MVNDALPAFTSFRHVETLQTGCALRIQAGDASIGHAAELLGYHIYTYTYTCIYI